MEIAGQIITQAKIQKRRLSVQNLPESQPTAAGIPEDRTQKKSDCSFE